MPPSPAIALPTLPNTRALLHFFSALPLGAPRRQKNGDTRWSTMHISRAAACCFVWLTRASPARVRCTQFCRALASLRGGEIFLRLRRAARCEVTVRGRHAIACRRLNALCGIAFAGTTRAPVACRAMLPRRRARVRHQLRWRVRVWTHRTARPLSAARAAARRAPPRPARHSLRVAVDYFLLRAAFSIQWARWRVFRSISTCACGHVCICFFKDFA